MQSMDVHFMALVVLAVALAVVGSATLWLMLSDSAPMTMAVEQVGQFTLHTG